MKSDFKLISGSWGMTPEDDYDLFRLQKSTQGGVIGTFNAASEEAKKVPPVRASVISNTVESQ